MDSIFRRSDNLVQHSHQMSREDVRKAREKRTDTLESLRRSLDYLVLVNCALWEIVQERLNISEEELMNKIHEIDLRDGVADDKMKKQAHVCDQCGRKMSRQHGRCLFCGFEDPANGPFDKLL